MRRVVTATPSYSHFDAIRRLAAGCAGSKCAKNARFHRVSAQSWRHGEWSAALAGEPFERQHGRASRARLHRRHARIGARLAHLLLGKESSPAKTSARLPPMATTAATASEKRRLRRSFATATDRELFPGHPTAASESAVHGEWGAMNSGEVAGTLDAFQLGRLLFAGSLALNRDLENE